MGIALGDVTLTPEEFEELAGLKLPLVMVKGKWVELRKEDIENAIAFFKKKKARNEMLMSQALRLALGQDAQETGLSVVGVEAEGWAGDIFERLSGGIRIRKLRAPGGFQGKLRPYQVKGYSWLQFLSRFGLGACLADDMGLGKTIEFIALMLRERKKGNCPSLIVCPMSIVENWNRHPFTGQWCIR